MLTIKKRQLVALVGLMLVLAAAVAVQAARPGAEPPKEGSSPTKFKYYPLASGETLNHFGTVLHLETKASEGWDFAGSLDMQLSEKEYKALKEGHEVAARVNGVAEPEKTYRVLVFKQPAKR